MLDISFGKNRSDTNWKPEYMEWEEFVELLRKVRRTAETMAEYDRMDKADKDKIKNGRAFVGGLVKGGRRKKENVENRWLITLDADNADEDFLFSVDLVLGGNAYVVYSTHSSRPNKLKYRLVLPVDRAMAPDEHAAISRKIADKIGLLYFDKTTFDVHRLMYLPSCSKDATPVLEIAEGEPLNVDSVLAEYIDWKDSAEWPRHPDTEKQLNAALQKLGNPEEKPGVIGVFCQVYSLTEGIEKFIPEVYEATSYEDRWTYTGGTSFGGLRVYDDWWAYSEHQSDPANDGHCHNIFDLVRIHKFGELDRECDEFTPNNKKPSFAAMLEFATEDPLVKKLAIEKEFGEIVEDDSEEEPENAWVPKLKTHPKNPKIILPTGGNIELILSNGAFKGTLAYDAFGNTEVIRKPLPWRGRERPQQEYEPWLGSDDSRLLHYFNKKYNLKADGVIKNAFVEVTRANKFHPIKEYIEAYTWDGTPRVDTLFIDYLGAANTHYVRQVTRKMLIAAIKRLYEPGCKFDEMLVLIGPQGAGKSSLLAKLGRKWFSDSLRTFENKEAAEHLQSAWIFEIGELSAMKKTEVEEVKAFLSKIEDRYRVAFDRIVTDFPRKCIFFGTTNTRDFLRDTTGNRRFWPVDVHPENARYNHWTHLTDTVIGQIWAEALSLYKSGESLQLDSEADKEAKRQQSTHMEVDPREGLIQEWLESPIEDDFGADKDSPKYHKRVCASQIWVECLNRKKGDMRPWEAKEICDIMRRMPGWIEVKGRVRVPGYGQQTAFDRIQVDAVNDNSPDASH